MGTTPEQIQNKNNRDATAQEKTAAEMQKQGMSFLEMQLATLKQIGEETVQSFTEAQQKSRARIGETPEKATVEQNRTALSEAQQKFPALHEQLKKQNEHLQKLKDFDAEGWLVDGVKMNAKWFSNAEDIVTMRLNLMNVRNEKIKAAEESIKATEKQMSDAMASMYVNAYFIAQKSSKTPQEVTKKTDAIALEAFDRLGENIPDALKNPLKEAKERALNSEHLKIFDRQYLSGDYEAALRSLVTENESNSPIGPDTHKFSRSEIAKVYLASTTTYANESKNISYRIATGSPAEQKLREGYVCLAFPGDTAEHAFGFMAMAKKMPDGSLSVSFFDQQGKTPTTQDSLTYQDEYHLLPRDIADSAATEAEMEKNFDRVVGKIPSFQKMGEATHILQTTFVPMKRLFIDAQAGEMPSDFVDSVKGMAQTLQNSNILSVIRANMSAVKNDLEILKKIPIGENGKLEQRIADLEKGYTKMARLLEDHTVEDFCDKILNPAFAAHDFKSWAIKEGVVMATAIGAAVLVGGLTFFTGGAGLAASAALGAAGGVIGSEAGYVISEYAGESEYGKGFSNKSQFGSYLSDEKVFDSSTGTFRKLEGSEVALSYGKDFAMNFVMTMATLGLGRALNAKLIKWVEASKGKSEVRNAVANLTKRVFDLNPQEVDILKSDEAVQKFLKRTFGEIFEEGGEEAVQNGVQQIDDNLSQVVGLITAMRGNSAIQQTVGGRAIRDGGFSLEGNKLVKTISVQGNAADVSGLSQRVSETMGAQGYSVKVNEDGTIDCTKSSANAEGGKSVILRFKEIFDEDISVGAAGAGGGDSDEVVSPLPETRLENESVPYPSARESDAVNRVFEGGQMGLGRNNPISLKTDPSSAYRQTGLDQIQDIVESGFVRPPIGKLVGGRRDEVHWSRGHEKLFYYMKVPVIEVDASKVEGKKKGAVRLADLKAIWIFNEATQQYENRLDAYKAQQEQTPLADSSIANFADTQARNVFPDDVEMQQLYKKSLIGLQVLTDVEQAALDTAFASREKPSSLHQVRLYESKHFVIPADAKNPEYILTNQLDGCTAVVVIAEMPNGERHVLISHFPPFAKERNVNELSALITPEIQGASKKTLLIVKNGKREVNTNQVRDGIQTALGENTVVKELKYTNNGKDGDGALIVEVPPKEKGVPSAHVNNNGEHVVLNVGEQVVPAISVEILPPERKQYLISQSSTPAESPRTSQIRDMSDPMHYEKEKRILDERLSSGNISDTQYSILRKQLGRRRALDTMTHVIELAQVFTRESPDITAEELAQHVSDHPSLKTKPNSKQRAMILEAAKRYVVDRTLVRDVAERVKTPEGKAAFLKAIRVNDVDPNEIDIDTSHPSLIGLICKNRKLYDSIALDSDLISGGLYFPDGPFKKFGDFHGSIALVDGTNPTYRGTLDHELQHGEFHRYISTVHEEKLDDNMPLAAERFRLLDETLAYLKGNKWPNSDIKYLVYSDIYAEHNLQRFAPLTEDLLALHLEIQRLQKQGFSPPDVYKKISSSESVQDVVKAMRSIGDPEPKSAGSVEARLSELKERYGDEAFQFAKDTLYDLSTKLSAGNYNEYEPQILEAMVRDIRLWHSEAADMRAKLSEFPELKPIISKMTMQSSFEWGRGVATWENYFWRLVEVTEYTQQLKIIARNPLLLGCVARCLNMSYEKRNLGNVVKDLAETKRYLDALHAQAPDIARRVEQNFYDKQENISAGEMREYAERRLLAHELRTKFEALAQSNPEAHARIGEKFDTRGILISSLDFHELEEFYMLRESIARAEKGESFDDVSPENSPPLDIELLSEPVNVVAEIASNMRDSSRIPTDFVGGGLPEHLDIGNKLESAELPIKDLSQPAEFEKARVELQEKFESGQINADQHEHEQQQLRRRSYLDLMTHIISDAQEFARLNPDVTAEQLADQLINNPNLPKRPSRPQQEMIRKGARQYEIDRAIIRERVGALSTTEGQAKLLVDLGIEGVDPADVKFDTSHPTSIGVIFLKPEDYLRYVLKDTSPDSPYYAEDYERYSKSVGFLGVRNYEDSSLNGKIYFAKGLNEKTQRTIYHELQHREFGAYFDHELYASPDSQIKTQVQSLRSRPGITSEELTQELKEKKLVSIPSGLDVQEEVEYVKSVMKSFDERQQMKKHFIDEVLAYTKGKEWPGSRNGYIGLFYSDIFSPEMQAKDVNGELRRTVDSVFGEMNRLHAQGFTPEQIHKRISTSETVTDMVEALRAMGTHEKHESLKVADLIAHAEELGGAHLEYVLRLNGLYGEVDPYTGIPFSSEQKVSQLEKIIADYTIYNDKTQRIFKALQERTDVPDRMLHNLFGDIDISEQSTWEKRYQRMKLAEIFFEYKDRVEQVSPSLISKMDVFDAQSGAVIPIEVLKNDADDLARSVRMIAAMRTRDSEHAKKVESYIETNLNKLSSKEIAEYTSKEFQAMRERLESESVE